MIPALRRLGQHLCELKASLVYRDDCRTVRAYTVRPCLKNKHKQKNVTFSSLLS